MIRVVLGAHSCLLEPLTTRTRIPAGIGHPGGCGGVRACIGINLKAKGLRTALTTSIVVVRKSGPGLCVTGRTRGV